MANQTTTINVRIDKATKMKAQKIVSDLGLDISSAIKEFLKKVVETKEIPFTLQRKGRMYDPKYITAMKKETEWAIKHGKRFDSAEELTRDILGK